MYDLIIWYEWWYVYVSINETLPNKTPPKFMYFFKFLLIAKKKILSGYWTRDGKMGFG